MVKLPQTHISFQNLCSKMLKFLQLYDSCLEIFMVSYILYHVEEKTVMLFLEISFIHWPIKVILSDLMDRKIVQNN